MPVTMVLLMPTSDENPRTPGAQGAAVAAVVAAAGAGLLARRKIGGISGDVLGAAEQVAECLCLVVLSGLALHR